MKKYHGNNNKRLAGCGVQRNLENPITKNCIHLSKMNISTHVIYPPADDIFNAFHFTPLSKVKVLILGQDPYHNVTSGTWTLVFQFCRTQKDIPPSLQNIYQELHDDLGCYIPNNGYLKKWADQGVLLLNTVLTVRAHQANSHQNKGWEQFTDAIIQAVNAQDRPIVYMLWGRPAQSKVPMLTNPKHLILTGTASKPIIGIQRIFRMQAFQPGKCIFRGKWHRTDRLADRKYLMHTLKTYKYGRNGT